MVIFAGLLLAHLLYDLHWQGAYVSARKRQTWFFMLVHSLTWALLLSAVLYHFDAYAPWKLLWLTGTHYAIDSWRIRETRLDPDSWGLYVDQALHLGTMLLVVLV